jgi:hypothetical protein
LLNARNAGEERKTFPSLAGLLLNWNNLDANPLSLRERVPRRAGEGRIAENLIHSSPHPTFGHPLPEGEGPRLMMIIVGYRPYPRRGIFALFAIVPRVEQHTFTHI